MHDYERDQFFGAVADVENVLEMVNIADLAYWLVKEVPNLAEQLATAIGFELMDQEITKND